MRNFYRYCVGVILVTNIIFLSGCGNGNNSATVNNPQAIAIQTIANQYLESYAETQGFSNITVTSQCHGVNNSQPFTISAGTIGYPNIDPRPVQHNSLWQIGSNSKSFASIVLLQLASDPQYNFSLDDPLTKWLPEYSYFTWPHGNVIPTIRQMLNMTSGIPDDITDNLLANLMPYTFISPTLLISYAGESLSFEPGSSYSYSNTNYDLLGLLIKRITGNSANTEITNRIINKLGLHNTFVVDNLPTDLVESAQLVHGYNNRQDISLQSLSWTFTAGNIISTPEDMNTYYKALLSTNRLLNKTQFNELTSFVSTSTGQPIKSFNNATGSKGYGLGIIGLDFSILNAESPALFANEPNILINLHKYNLVYDYTGGTLGFVFKYTYNPATDTLVVVGINAGWWDSRNLVLINKVMFSVLNSLETSCKMP